MKGKEILSPVNDYLVVEVLKNENEGGGILLPDVHKKEEWGVGLVVAVDESVEIVKIGDKVVFDKDLLINVKIEGEETKFLKFSDVLGYITEGVELENVAH